MSSLLSVDLVGRRLQPPVTAPSLVLRRTLIMEAPALHVLESSIHGKGVFASRDLAAGEEALRMDPECFSTDARHPWNRQNGDILPYYLNHSCDPNSSLVLSTERREMVLITTHPIAKGEEVTLDYWQIEFGGERIPCQCGTRICRGYFPINREKR